MVRAWTLIVLALALTGATLLQSDPYVGLFVCGLAVGIGAASIRIAFSGKI